MPRLPAEPLPPKDTAELAMTLALKCALVETLENDAAAEEILKLALPHFVRGARDLLQVQMLTGKGSL